MNFKIVQAAIKAGWETNENDFDSIRFDKDFLEYVSFERLDDDDILEIFDEIENDDFISWLKQHKTKVEIVNLFDGYNDWEVIYKMVENEREVYECDVAGMSTDLINAYLVQIGDHYDSDLKWKKIFEKYGLGIDAYIKKIIKDDSNYDLEDSDIKNFFNNNAATFTKKELSSNGMINLFNDYPQTSIGMLYLKTYDDKLLCFSQMMESVDWSEDIMKLYVDKTRGIYAEDIDNKLISAQIRREQKDYKSADKKTNRISADEAKAYIYDNEFVANIQVISGHIGLEDMTFDHIYINGELQGDRNSMRRSEIADQRVPWIKDRDFGDNSMSKDWFYETVNKYLT